MKKINRRRSRRRLLGELPPSSTTGLFDRAKQDLRAAYRAIGARDCAAAANALDSADQRLNALMQRAPAFQTLAERLQEARGAYRERCLTRKRGPRAWFSRTA